jgi:hypothetical protein
MDASIFKKMKARAPCVAAVMHAPSDYPRPSEFDWSDTGQADLVHLFVESREQFKERFSQAANACKEDGALWISYPKSKGKTLYDINRDSLWNLLLAAGFHPVSQIALNEEWSAVRVKRNEADIVYELPKNVKR